MNEPVTQILPPMAATVLHAGSPQRDLMRFGKERKRPALISVDGQPAKQTLAVSTAIYDGLAVLYNESEVNALLVVDLPNRPTMGNLNRILKGRGLVQGEDYLAYRAKFDVDGNRYPVKDRPLVIERLTASPMKVSTGKNSYGQEMAAQARERGEASPSLTHARKLGEKGRKGELDEERVQAALTETSPLDDILAGAETPSPLMQDAQSELDRAEMRELDDMELPPLEVGE